MLAIRRMAERQSREAGEQGAWNKGNIGQGTKIFDF